MEADLTLFCSIFLCLQLINLRGSIFLSCTSLCSVSLYNYSSCSWSFRACPDFAISGKLWWTWVCIYMCENHWMDVREIFINIVKTPTTFVILKYIIPPYIASSCLSFLPSFLLRDLVFIVLISKNYFSKLVLCLN